MTAAQRDIEIVRGDGYRHKLEFVREDDSVIDVTDWVVTSSVRDWWTGDAHQDFSVDEDASDRPNGVIWIFLSSEQTAQPDLPDRSVWDVQYATPDEPEPTTFLRGNVRFQGQATQ